MNPFGAAAAEKLRPIKRGRGNLFTLVYTHIQAE